MNTTDYIVDVTTEDKAGLMSYLSHMVGITSVTDGGCYREDANWSQVHISALSAVWGLVDLDAALYTSNFDIAGIVLAGE